MTGNELYTSAINRVNAIRTDEDRFSSGFTRNMLLTALAAARQVWVERHNGTLPSQWFLSEWLTKDDAEQYDQFEGEDSCLLKFKIPNFVQIKGVSTLSVSYPDGRPFSFIAQTYTQYHGWLQHDFYKKKDLAYIEEGILNLKVKVDLDSIVLRGVPMDAEQISTYNVMHDDYPATDDLIDMAMDKILKPMMYIARIPIDSVSNSKDQPVKP